MARLCLLGDVTLHVDERRVELGPARQRCVWAALAIDVGRVVPVQRLIERVWGNDPPLRARAALLTYLSRLRQVLADVRGVDLVRRSGGYLLHAEQEAVDLHRFRVLCARARGADDVLAARSLTEALLLWRGEALTGLEGEWPAAERDRLGRERLAAQHDLVDVRLRLGHGEDLVVELAERAAEHPLDERVAGQYLLALYRAGRAADALEHYRRLRERLVEELGTDPGAALHDLHGRVLAADPTLTAAARPDAPAAVVPRQLPAVPTSFVGRREEVSGLDAALRGTTSTVVIAGAGGIGKTWLALHWAHRNVERFPDGQLFVDLRGFGPDGQPVDPAAAVHGFLGALGADLAALPADQDARIALYRGLLADRRVLIVLDNAASTDQVVPLLPGTGSCAVLVTSRNRLPGLLTRHGARPLPLDVLTRPESRRFLAAALGAARTASDDVAVTDLIGLCGGFPLALGVVAARAAADPHLPLADTVAELRKLGLDALDSADPAASLPAVLSWSLRHLTEAQRRVFALVSIAPGTDVGLPAATSLTGLPVRDTHALLSALADASLLTRAAGGRYGMHDLVRAYATTLARDLPEPVRRVALERVVDFYLRTAHTADRLLDPHRELAPLDPSAHRVDPHPLPDDPAAMTWLDAEHANLLAVQRTAAALGRHRVVWQLARVLRTFHYRRGHGHDALVVWRAALEAAEHLPDVAARVLALRRIGLAHAWLAQYESATEHVHRALVLAERHDERTEQAHAHHTLAWVWEQRGDDRLALGHARRALALYRALGLPVEEAGALNTVGWCAARLHDYDTARSHCLAALALNRRDHDRDGEAHILDSLGWIDHHTGRHREAVDHYRQALALYRVLGNTRYCAYALEHLGHPHAALGQHEQAGAVWREALVLYRQQGRDDEAERVRRQLDELDSARLTNGSDLRI